MPVKTQIKHEVFTDADPSLPIMGGEYDGWYCVSIASFRCQGCNKSISFLEPDHTHIVLVWEENDDENLLDICKRFMRNGDDPHIVQYKPTFGPCIAYKEAKAGNETNWVDKA